MFLIFLYFVVLADLPNRPLGLYSPPKGNSMTSLTLNPTQNNRFSTWLPMLAIALLIAAMIFMPEAYAGSGAAGAAGTKIQGFFADISGILKTVSVVVITIAIIFSGYQIAFAHKRISDVAPILIGALLIGGASQIAAMLVQ